MMSNLVDETGSTPGSLSRSHTTAGNGHTPCGRVSQATNTLWKSARYLGHQVSIAECRCSVTLRLD